MFLISSRLLVCYRSLQTYASHFAAKVQGEKRGQRQNMMWYKLVLLKPILCPLSLLSPDHKMFSTHPQHLSTDNLLQRLMQRLGELLLLFMP